jgi:hypothetical protein
MTTSGKTGRMRSGRERTDPTSEQFRMAAAEAGRGK